MNREDEGLGFLLRYDNIASYDKGKIRVLDRRIYPEKIEFLTLTTIEDCALALKNMVTQSGGPLTFAPLSMALTAYKYHDANDEIFKRELEHSSHLLSTSRPTTSKTIYSLTSKMIDVALKARQEGRREDEAIREAVISNNNFRYKRIRNAASLLVERFPTKATLMTQCFGEVVLGMILKEAKRQKGNVRLFVPETRPYLQGARLTSSVSYDMGIDTTLITDNMASFVMKNENVDAIFTASDVITLSGAVCNKVGTLGLAILSSYYSIPFYVVGIPNRNIKTEEDITVEMRDGEGILYAMGKRTNDLPIKGYYPSFDITPPSLITGIATDIALFKPEEVASYFDKGGNASF